MRGRPPEALVDRIPAGPNVAEQCLAQFRTHVDELRIRLANIDGRTTEIKHNQLASLAAAIGDCRSQLTDVDLRTAEIMAFTLVMMLPHTSVRRKRGCTNWW